jgi:predicted porin
MKKGLLTTSALVAAGMLTVGADAQAQTKPTNPVQLRLGGYMEQMVGVTFNKPNSAQRHTEGTVAATEERSAFDQQTESEIHIIGDGRLDNGLVIRAVFELEVTGSPGDQWDEQYLILRNGFGQLILGNEDPVASLMNNGYGFGLVTNAGQSVTYDSQGFLPQPSGFIASPTAGPARAAFVDYYDSDSSKVIYVSPRFFGLQVGASYAPESGRDQLTPSALGGADTGRRLPGEGVAHAMWSFGANYEFNVSDFKIGLAAGYQRAQEAQIAAGVGPGNPESWVVGARVDWGGFRFATGYSQLNGSPLQTALLNTGGVNTQSPDGWGWKAGVLYSWGANAVSLNGQIGAEDGLTTNSDSDHIQKVVLAYARTLAPGIKWTANLFYANYDAEVDSATERDYHGVATTTSIRLDF